MKLPQTVALCLALASSLTSFGHVTVAPLKSVTSATETYSFRVPSEGGRTTTAVILTVPKGVAVLSVAIPKDGGNVAFQRKATDERDQVVWTIEIKPGASVQLAITATNGAEDDRIVWKITQKYADGTSADWVPATTLEAAPAVPVPVSR